MTRFRRFLGITFGVIFGALGGLLIYTEAGILAGIHQINLGFVVLFFLGGWVLITTFEPFKAPESKDKHMH